MEASSISFTFPGPQAPPLYEETLPAQIALALDFQVDQGCSGLELGGSETGRQSGGEWRRPGPFVDHLLHRMIPEEQKGPVMAAMGDQATPGKVDSALVHSSDPILSRFQTVAA